MEILTENNGFAIIWMNKKYFIRHLKCGTFLRANAHRGCWCGASYKQSASDNALPVDEIILKKFNLLTRGEKK